MKQDIAEFDRYQTEENLWSSFIITAGPHRHDWYMHRENCEAAARLGYPNAIEQLQSFENFKAFKRLTR